MIRRLFVIALVAAQGCGPVTDPERTFTPVDSAGGDVVADLFVDFSTFRAPIGPPPVSWTNGGSTLMVATPGPILQYPTNQSSLWSVSVPTRALTKLFTWPTTDGILGVDCRAAVVECDLVYSSGRVLRRGPAGDTTQILLKSTGGHYSSPNGRFLAFTEDGMSLWTLDVTTGARRKVVESSSARWLTWRPLAVSDDGEEVAVAIDQPMVVTRHSTSDGAVTTRTITPPPVGQGGIRALRWVGTALYALVEWRTPTEAMFMQYRLDQGTSVLLGITGDGAHSDPNAWRPELQRIVVNRLSACDRRSEFERCFSEQWELELLRGGPPVRVARSSYGFWNMSLSPDGRQLAHGLSRVILKTLPD